MIIFHLVQSASLTSLVTQVGMAMRSPLKRHFISNILNPNLINNYSIVIIFNNIYYFVVTSSECIYKFNHIVHNST